MKIKLEKLDKPVQSGDWHDPALKWTVNGPGAEVQMFYTKVDAQKYKKARKQSKNQNDAIFKWMRM